VTESARNTTTSQQADPEEQSPQKESLIVRLRRKYPWLDHLVRANEAFDERYGNHYAAAITYFSVLSLFPLLMIAVSVAGFVLSGNPELMNQLTEAIKNSVPENLQPLINQVVQSAQDSAGAVGVFGLLTALYSGIGWISNLRDALTAQWGQEKQQLPMLKKTLWDLLALIGLGLALLFSFAVTAAGSALRDPLLSLVGLQDNWLANAVFQVIIIVITLGAAWAVFVWVISRLPRERVSSRSALKGGLAAAIGFVILQQVASYYLSSVTSSPTGALFGPIIGLLVFANLVSRFLLFITAWTATAKENEKRVVEPPPPAVIRPRLEVRKGAGTKQAVGLFGTGALTALVMCGLRRKR
jgi:membrane protein